LPSVIKLDRRTAMTAFGRRCLGLVLGLCLLFPAAAVAQNETAAYAADLSVGGFPLTLELSSTELARWYDMDVRPGRSYCVQVGVADYEYHYLDTVLEVFRGDGTTPVASNDDIVTEPDAEILSRACWIATSAAATYNTVRVSIDGTYYAIPSGNHSFAIRVFETTLWCPWFFINGDYNAFTLLRNTTDASVNVTVTWRDANGTAVGTYSGAIPGNGNLSLNARNYVTAATSGSIEIAHDGSAEAIQGSTTTLSGTTGVGFDAMFTQRRAW
jgi:hypothetical protein